MRLIKEVKDFFESYKVMNTLIDVRDIDISIFEAVSRNVLQIKITERNLKRVFRREPSKNMFCDVKVEGNIVTMLFKYKEAKLSKEFLSIVKSIKKNDYIIHMLGNQLKIIIVDPRIEEIIKVFQVLEPHCRKFKK